MTFSNSKTIQTTCGPNTKQISQRPTSDIVKFFYYLTCLNPLSHSSQGYYLTCLNQVDFNHHHHHHTR